MNDGPSLALKHIFGYRFDVLNGLHFIDETSVLYCAGHSTVIHSLEDEVFIHLLSSIVFFRFKLDIHRQRLCLFFFEFEGKYAFLGGRFGGQVLNKML